MSALAPPATVPPTTGTADGSEAQRLASAHVDELLRRVAALTGVLGGNPGSGWDEVDQLAARLLIADLGAVASTTRALNDLAASRLAGALADLQAAGVDVQRVLKEASGS